MQFYCIPLQPLTASDVHRVASSVEHHPSLRELTAVGGCSESLVKGAVEGVARRHGVEKLGVTPFFSGEYLYTLIGCSCKSCSPSKLPCLSLANSLVRRKK